MNIVSTIVGLSIMGAAAPSMMTMSIAPFEAQKRAQNLGVAESAAVTYAAANEDTLALGKIPEECTLDTDNAPAYEISCTEGKGTKYAQTVKRSFITDPSASNSNNITFPMLPPEGYSHYPCPGPGNPMGWQVDSWGTAYYNQRNLGGQHCIPFPAQGDGIDPNDDMSTWLWDLRVHFGR